MIHTRSFIYIVPSIAFIVLLHHIAAEYVDCSDTSACQEQTVSCIENNTCIIDCIMDFVNQLLIVEYMDNMLLFI